MNEQESELHPPRCQNETKSGTCLVSNLDTGN